PWPRRRNASHHVSHEASPAAGPRVELAHSTFSSLTGSAPWWVASPRLMLQSLCRARLGSAAWERLPSLWLSCEGAAKTRSCTTPCAPPLGPAATTRSASYPLRALCPGAKLALICPQGAILGPVCHIGTTRDQPLVELAADLGNPRICIIFSQFHSTREEGCVKPHRSQVRSDRHAPQGAADRSHGAGR